MFGRPVRATTSSPGSVTPPPKSNRAVRRETRAFEHASDTWGSRSNFDLAGPNGRVGNLVADLWSQWWRPWALLGILIVVLAVVLLLSA